MNGCIMRVTEAYSTVNYRTCITTPTATTPTTTPKHTITHHPSPNTNHYTPKAHHPPQSTPPPPHHHSSTRSTSTQLHAISARSY